jgi:hypothetical protein
VHPFVDGESAILIELMLESTDLFHVQGGRLAAVNLESRAGLLAARQVI